MSNKKKIYTILFSLVFLICLTGFLWSFVVTKDIRKDKTGKHAKNQVVTVKNLILTETKEGRIYWELYAAKGNYESGTGKVTLTDATGNFYNEKNEVVLSFESDIGTYVESSKEITLQGNTHVVAYEGSSIKADEIIWQGSDEDILANGNVYVTRGEDFVSVADKARFNSKLTYFEISGKTETNIFDKKGTKPQSLTKK